MGTGTYIYPSGEITGQYSNSVVTANIITVTGFTQINNNYQIFITPKNSLSATLFYVANKTINSFDVIYLSGLTGTVAFDWQLRR